MTSHTSLVNYIFFVVVLFGMTPAMGEEILLTDNKLESLVEKEWQRLKSSYSFTPSHTQSIAWVYRFTPPLPLLWPPKASHNMVFYGYPQGLTPGPLADGEHIGEPWVKVEVVAARAPRVRVLLEEIKSLGIQGVRPLSKDETRMERHQEQGPRLVTELARLPKNDEPAVEKIRSYYCMWIRHNGVIAKHLAGTHADFFEWLQCPALIHKQ